MRYIENSSSLIIGEQTESQINLFIQFFIHSNEERYNEIKSCLQYNVENPLINYIYLLNEYQPDGTYRPFTDEELGISSEKIIQIPLGNRLRYNDVFRLAKDMNCNGYNIIANADIFFDESLKNILKSDMNEKPIMMCQLRWNYDGTPMGIKIFGPRADSQDAWIWHSKWNNKLQNKAFNFQLGQAGCDNHITYLFKICGFELVNDPQLVHCLHYHKTEIRDYKAKDTIKPPYILLTPKDAFIDKIKDVKFEDNEVIYNYIREIGNKPFIIPRVAGIENISAYNILHTDIPIRYDIMKNNAGLKISCNSSMKKYAKKYYDSFKNCEIYTGWSKDGEDNVYGGLNISQDIIQDIKYKDRKKVWAHCLDVFEYINYTPWTLALEGKRILIISSFIESFKKKIPILDKIYGREIFKNNTFIFVKPPMLNGDSISEEWDIEANKFCSELDNIKDEYDIALVSCGGLGNIICNHIFKSDKQAIYVGGTLQMYFGVYGNRWLHERSAILRMYLNEHWSRPMQSERPQGHHKVEGGCYF